MSPIPGPTPLDGTQLQWRVYPPGWHLLPVTNSTPSPTPTPTPGPCVLVVHGGSWVSGSPFQANIEHVASILAVEGFWVFVGDYRVAPPGRIYPNQPSGGCISAYATLFRGAINETGRPQWTGGDNGTPDLRPDCLVTFSSPFDLSDQIAAIDELQTKPYIGAVQNYIGDCDRTHARQKSPISLIDAGTRTTFKPMFMVQAIQDEVCPYRQIIDMQAALYNVGVCPDDVVLGVVDDQNGDYQPLDHALGLWEAPYVDQNGNPTGLTCGQKAVDFLHEHLDP